MTDITDKTTCSSNHGDVDVVSKIVDQPVDDSSIVRTDSQLSDQSGIETGSKSAEDQSELSEKETLYTRQTGEKDSPTKQFDEFTELIGQTEASMRDKLSELTLPGTNDGDQVNADISVTVETQEGHTEREEIENTCHEESKLDTGTSSVDEETSHENTSQFVVTDVSSDATRNRKPIDEVRSERLVSTNDSESSHVQDNQELAAETSDREVVVNEGVSGNVTTAEEGSESGKVQTAHAKEAEMAESGDDISTNPERKTNTGSGKEIKDLAGDLNDKHCSPIEVQSLAEDREVSDKNDKDKVVTVAADRIELSSVETTLICEKQIDNIQRVDIETPEVVDAVPKKTFIDDVMMDTTENVGHDNACKNVSSESKLGDGSCDISTVSVYNTSTDNQDLNSQQLNKISKDSINVTDVETDSLQSKEELGNSLEECRDENTGKETTDVCEKLNPSSTDNELEESFMIIDVRSLTENSGTDDNNTFSSNESTFKKSTEDGFQDSANVKQHENQGNIDMTLPKISETGSVVLEKSQSSKNSKSKRKSPNSVRRITDETDLAVQVIKVSDYKNHETRDHSSPSSSVQTVTSTPGRSLLSDVVVTTSGVTASESESLPIISNTFSMKDFSNSISVKKEPPDDGMYGVMPNYENVSHQTPSSVSAEATAVAFVPGNTVVHRGQIVSQGRQVSFPQKSARPSANPQKLVISKVPPMVCPKGVAVSMNSAPVSCPTAVTVSFVSSAPATLTRYPLSSGVTQATPRVQAVPRARISGEGTGAVVTLRHLAPRNGAPVSVQNGNMPAILTSVVQAKDHSKDKVKDTSQINRKLSTINIHSVGVARITDLIARKNPIPTFKPDPIPENLKTIQSSKIYPCYECGDSFHFEKSLKQHLGRCSMKIFYRCEKCLTKIMFTNKCQLLNHLRSHLNIEKTQAVPIHIKSDSIEIETNYNDINVNKPFEWYKESNISQSVNAREAAPLSVFQCLECHKVFEDGIELRDHFQGNDSEYHFCEDCPLYLNSKCAFQAHAKLHKLDEVKLTKLYFDEWRLLKTLSCPECGKHFWKPLGEGTVTGLLNNMTLHLKNVCFHLSRLPAYNCTKCMKVFQSFSGMQNHLKTSLEHYYKCGLCPMALKSLKSLESHYGVKHRPAENTDEVIDLKAKIIYRCHVCDTLIDDKSFLVQHIDKHLDECTKHPETHYHCLQCGQIFMKKTGLLVHYSKHAAVRRQMWCTFCSRDKVRAIPYITHMLKFHTSAQSGLASKSVVKFCDHCGLVCVGEHMFQKHDCLVMRNAPIVIGDKPESKKLKEGTKTAERKEVSKTGSATSTEVGNLPSGISETCVACSKVFVSQAQRQSHLRDHRDLDMIFICKFCDKMNFSSYHMLRSHEIACTALSKMPKDVSTSGPQKKQSTAPYGKIRSKAELANQMKTMPSDDMEKNKSEKKSFTDGVELTPKENTKSSKCKKEVVEFYMCDKCDAVFTRKSKQEEHIKSEHGIHPCHLCGLMHDSQSSLKKHLMVDHEGKRMLLYCGVCKNRKIDKAFSVREKIIKHFKVKHRMKVIDESKIITHLPGLPEPVKETTPESQKRKLSASPETSVKKLRIEGETEFKCAKCLFTSDVKSEFRHHILKHKATDSYQCLECGLCFAVLPSLKKHVFMVHKVRDFESYMEENKIEEPTALEDKDVGIIQEPEIEDEEAFKESSEEELSGNPLECKVCYKSFESEKILKSHMRIHGMAFIKKSRRRAKATSAPKRSGNNVSYSSSQEEGNKEGLIIKIKRLKTVNDVRNDSKLTDTKPEVTEEPMETEVEADSNPVDSSSEIAPTSENLESDEKSVEKDPEESSANTDITGDGEYPGDIEVIAV